MYKDFDIDRAKKGDSVVFKSEIHGLEFRDARILCFDRKSRDDRFPIIALIGINDEERSGIFDMNGFDPSGYPRLFMAPVKRQEWVNIHYVLDKWLPNGQYYVVHRYTFKSEQDAIGFVEENGLANYMKSVLIREWEE
jgi:hypothetical protein